MPTLAKCLDILGFDLNIPKAERDWLVSTAGKQAKVDDIKFLNGQIDELQKQQKAIGKQLAEVGYAPAAGKGIKPKEITHAEKGVTGEKKLTPKEQKEWLLSEIDKEIEKAEIGSMGMIKFKVPNSTIEYNISNDKKRLESFRKRVKSKFPVAKAKFQPSQKSKTLSDFLRGQKRSPAAEIKAYKAIINKAPKDIKSSEIKEFVETIDDSGLLVDKNVFKTRTGFLNWLLGENISDKVKAEIKRYVIEEQPQYQIQDSQRQAINDIKLTTYQNNALKRAISSLYKIANPTDTDVKDFLNDALIDKSLRSKLVERSLGGILEDRIAVEKRNEAKSIPKTIQETELQNAFGPDAKPLEASTPNEKALERIVKGLGWNVKFVDSAVGANGVVLPSDTSTFYINKQSTRPLMAVAGHEISHLIERNAPDLYKFLTETLDKRLHSFEDWLHEYNKRRAEKGFPAVSEEQARKELYGDFIGESLLNGRTWNAMLNENPTLTAQLIEIIKMVLDKITRAVKRHAPSYKYFKDIKTAQKVVGRVLGEAAERQVGTGPVFEFAQSLDIGLTQAEKNVENNPNYQKWFNNGTIKHTLYHGTIANEDFNIIKPGDTMPLARGLGVHLAKDPSVSQTFAMGDYTLTSNYVVNNTNPEQSWYKDRFGNIKYDGIIVVRDHITKEIEPYNKKKYGSLYKAESLKGKFLGIARPKGRILPVKTNIKHPLKVTVDKYSDDASVAVAVGKIVMPMDKNLFVDAIVFNLGYKKEEASKLWDDLSSGKGGLIYKNFNDFAENQIGALNNVDRKKITNLLEKAGYDGIIYKNTSTNEVKEGADPTSYIIFHPEQIKSIYNRGSYSLTDPRIDYQVKQPGAVWYSQMEETLNEKLPKTSTPSNMKNMINAWAQKFFKEEELEWSGLNEWIDSLVETKIKKPISKTTDKVKKEDPYSHIYTFKDGTRIGASSEAEAIREYNFDKYGKEQLETSPNEILVKGKVTKQQILDYLAENNVRVEEVVKGSGKNEYEGIKSYNDYKDAEIYEYVHTGIHGVTTYFKKVGDEIHEFLESFNGEMRFQEQYDSLESLERAKREEWRYGVENTEGLEGTTKFSQYRTSGGENYREFFLTADSRFESWEDGHSEYSDVKNPIVRIRFDTRTNVNGDTILFIDELQPPQKTQLANMPEFMTRPKYYVTMAIKRMVRYASENGFDKIAWTPGEIQADRYDLSKQVEAVVWEAAPKGKVDLLYVDKTDGEEKYLEGGVPLEKIDHYVGKDLGEKIREQYKTESTGKFDGLDLKVGGEGMKGFYDKILPAAVNKFFNKKAWGRARVGTTNIETDEATYKVEHRGGADLPFQLTLRDSTNIIESFKTAEEAWAKAEKLGKIEVWSLPITDEMRFKAAHEGMPLFQIADGINDNMNKAKQAYQADPDVVTKGNRGIGYVNPSEKKMGLIRRITGIPRWVAKKWPNIKKLTDDALESMKNKQTAIHTSVLKMKTYFDLKGDAWNELRKLSLYLDMEGSKGVDKLEAAGPAFHVGKDHIEIVPERYTNIKKILVDMGFSDKVAQAYADSRKELDSIWVNLDKFLTESGVDTSEIQEFRNNIRKLHNYIPHKRYGSRAVLIVDPTQKTQEGKTYKTKGSAEGVIKRKGLSKTHKAFESGEGWVIKAKPGMENLIYYEAIPSMAGFTLRGNTRDITAKAVKWAHEHGHPEVTPEHVRFNKRAKLPDQVFFNLDLQAMSQIIEQGIKRSEKDSDTEIREQLKESIMNSVAEEVSLRGFGQHTIFRKNIPGYETQDLKRVMLDYLVGANGMIEKAKLAKKLGKTMNERDDNGNLLFNAKSDPEQYNYASNYVRDVLTNKDHVDTIVDNIRGALFAKYLGLVIKTATLNLTQNMVAAWPRLTVWDYNLKKGEKPTQIRWAGAELLRAMRDTKKALMNFKQKEITLVKKGMTEKEKINAEKEEQFLRELIIQGINQDQLLSELRGDTRMQNPILNKIMGTMGLPMQMAEIYNRTSTALAAYRIAMKKLNHMPKAEQRLAAQEHAENVVLDSHYLYGKINYPEAIRGSAAAKMLRPLYTFRTFTHNYGEMMNFLMHQGWVGQKAALKSIGALGALGGLMALPFYDSWDDAYKKLFGETPVTHARKNIESQLMRDLVSFGALGAMGVDLHGSLGIELPKHFTDLLGVPWAVIEDSSRMSADLKMHDYIRAIEDSPVTPMFVRNAMSGYRQYEKGTYTRTGTPIGDLMGGTKEPRKLNFKDFIMKSIFGFQPLSASKSYEAYKELGAKQKEVGDVRVRLAKKYVEAKRKGNRKEMRNIKQWLRVWNEKARKDGKRYLVIDLKKSVEYREESRKPSVKFRGEAKRLRDIYS